MSSRGTEILEELKKVASGKTLDALLPPLIFVLSTNIFRLDLAILISLSLAIILGVIRLIRRQAWQYALGGLLGVLLASGLAYFTRSAVNYFIPAILSSAILLLIAFISLLAGKPMAAWASHLTRGWPLEWFWRKDIKPAYLEVTVFWAVLIAMRMFIQIILFLSGDAARLAWTNFLLGWPFTILILIITYIYGLWRLRQLGGPGADEYMAGKEPPWEGQLRGF